MREKSIFSHIKSIISTVFIRAFGPYTPDPNDVRDNTRATSLIPQWRKGEENIGVSSPSLVLWSPYFIFAYESEVQGFKLARWFIILRAIKSLVLIYPERKKIREARIVHLLHVEENCPWLRRLQGKFTQHLLSTPNLKVIQSSRMSGIKWEWI